MNESKTDSPATPGSPRRRFTRAERDRLLEEFDQSGLSGAAFARQQGIGYSTLAAWRKKRSLQQAGSSSSETSPFVELKFSRPPVAGGMMIRMGSLELEVHHAGHLAWAERLLRTLREEPC